MIISMYNIGFRQAAIRLYASTKSMKTVSINLNISLSTIWNWLHKGIDFKKRYPKALQPDFIVKFIKDTLTLHPSLTQQELRSLVMEKFNLLLSRHCVSSILQSLNFSRKRIRFKGDVKKERLDSEVQRFSQQLKDSKNIIAVDECGFDFRCLPIYGYSQRGEKIRLKALSTNNRTRITLILGIGENGKTFFQFHNGSINSSTFKDFVSLCPIQSSLLMDNASIHKTKLIQDFTLSRQQSLLFIPPYSPECNPVENVFSMIKNDFRKQVILTPQKEYKDILIPIIKKLDGSLYKRCFSHMRKWVENYHLTL